MTEGQGGSLVPQPEPAPPAPVQQRPMTKERLASERVIINAPLSFAGASQRAWRIGGNMKGAGRAAMVAFVVIPIMLVWWVAVCLWYLVFGLYLLPYRLLRRGARRRKAEALRHREMLGAMDTMRGDKEQR